MVNDMLRLQSSTAASIGTDAGQRRHTRPTWARTAVDLASTVHPFIPAAANPRRADWPASLAFGHGRSRHGARGPNLATRPQLLPPDVPFGVVVARRLVSVGGCPAKVSFVAFGVSLVARRLVGVGCPELEPVPLSVVVLGLTSYPDAVALGLVARRCRSGIIRHKQANEVALHRWDLHRLHTGLGSRSDRYVCWTIRRLHSVTASASSVRATMCQMPSRSA